MTEVPEISYGALSVITVDEAVRERAAEALHRAVTAEYGSHPHPWNDEMRPETMRMFRRHALAVIKELQRIAEEDRVEPALPRDWVANEVGPDTPYVDEPSVMVPTGTYLLGGFTDDPEDGPQLMLRVEHALDNDSDDAEWTPLSLAQAVADRLNGGPR